MKAMHDNLQKLKTGIYPQNSGMSFDELKTRVGFDDYYELEQRYSDKRED